jgi:hypothetical protein
LRFHQDDVDNLASSMPLASESKTQRSTGRCNF